ncbi:MAG TPA: D-alanyl-D-alanine carboxypeptidase family protein [Polyangia bacterium]|nr:D-alanyl-D-alanine carboxypeptidase family protein [Polyangia bacterium]
MGERQTGPLGSFHLHLDLPYAPNFQRDNSPLRLVLPGPLGTPDWHSAAGHNRTESKKRKGPPTASPELAQFKKDLIAMQVEARVKQGKKAILGLTGEELKHLEEARPFQMAAAVAPEFDKMWKKAKEDFAKRSAANPTDFITVASTYRSAQQDAIAWENAFVGYYNDTLEERQKTGYEFSHDALVKIFNFMNGKKAPPGFSGHTHGIAADLLVKENGVTWKVDSHHANQVGWQKTWLYHWLVDNAAQYHFFQLKTETWHWEYHADDKAKKFNCWDGDVKVESRKVK